MKLPALMIVEDEVLIAEDIAELCRLKGYEVKGIALNAGQALNMFDEIEPDLVLLDINLMDEVNGIEIATKLQKEMRIPFIFITSFTDEKTLEQVSELNPMGFIVKPFNKFQLYASIELAWQKCLDKRDSSLMEVLDKLEANLTNREYDVLENLISGKTGKEIGKALFLSENTIKYHIKKIYKKLDVHSKAELFIKLR